MWVLPFSIYLGLFTTGCFDFFVLRTFQLPNSCSRHFVIEMTQLLLCSVKQCHCRKMLRED